MLSFDRFTEQAQSAAARAYETLLHYGHGLMESEHLLLALLEEPEGSVPQLLEKLSVDQPQLKQRLNDLLAAMPVPETVQRGPEGQVHISVGVFQALELANEEAQQAPAELISTKHLLLGLLAESDTAVAGLLSGAEITKERVRQAL